MSDSALKGDDAGIDIVMKPELNPVEAGVHGLALSVDSEVRDELAGLARRLSNLEYVVRCQRPRTGSGDRWSGTIVMVAAFTVCAYLVYSVGLPGMQDLGVGSMILDAARSIRDTFS